MEDFSAGFVKILVGLSAIIAAMPTALQISNLVPEIGGDFASYSRLLVSINCYLSIAIVFFYRRSAIRQFIEAEKIESNTGYLVKVLLHAPIILFAFTLISVATSYHLLQEEYNLRKPSVFVNLMPLFAYAGIFTFPVLALSFIAVKEMALQKIDTTKPIE